MFPPSFAEVVVYGLIMAANKKKSSSPPTGLHCTQQWRSEVLKLLKFNRPILIKMIILFVGHLKKHLQSALQASRRNAADEIKSLTINKSRNVKMSINKYFKKRFKRTGRLFQSWGALVKKAQSPLVYRLDFGAASRAEEDLRLQQCNVIP